MIRILFTINCKRNVIYNGSNFDHFWAQNENETIRIEPECLIQAEMLRIDLNYSSDER